MEDADLGHIPRIVPNRDAFAVKLPSSPRCRIVLIMGELSKLTASAPVLLVKDVVAGANHYRDKMGFAYERFWGEPPSFVILHRDGMYIMLRQAADPKHVVPH